MTRCLFASFLFFIIASCATPERQGSEAEQRASSDLIEAPDGRGRFIRRSTGRPWPFRAPDN
ncbi:MAG: hypothetical protein AAF968_10735 [Pseudomonadota bacterium]